MSQPRAPRRPMGSAWSGRPVTSVWRAVSKSWARHRRAYPRRSCRTRRRRVAGSGDAAACAAGVVGRTAWGLASPTRPDLAMGTTTHPGGPAPAGAGRATALRQRSNPKHVVGLPTLTEHRAWFATAPGMVSFMHGPSPGAAQSSSACRMKGEACHCSGVRRPSKMSPNAVRYAGSGSPMTRTSAPCAERT